PAVSAAPLWRGPARLPVQPFVAAGGELRGLGGGAAPGAGSGSVGGGSQWHRARQVREALARPEAQGGDRHGRQLDLALEKTPPLRGGRAAGAWAELPTVRPRARTG